MAKWVCAVLGFSQQNPVVEATKFVQNSLDGDPNMCVFII